MKAGFRGQVLTAIEIADSFGQHSVLQFGEMAVDATLPAETFRFTVPPGTDLTEQ